MMDMDWKKPMQYRKVKLPESTSLPFKGRVAEGMGAKTSGVYADFDELTHLQLRFHGFNFLPGHPVRSLVASDRDRTLLRRSPGPAGGWVSL